MKGTTFGDCAPLAGDGHVRYRTAPPLEGMDEQFLRGVKGSDCFSRHTEEKFLTTARPFLCPGKVLAKGFKSTMPTRTHEAFFQPGRMLPVSDGSVRVEILIHIRFMSHRVMNPQKLLRCTIFEETWGGEVRVFLR